jgi:hypothetical protein
LLTVDILNDLRYVIHPTTLSTLSPNAK